MKEWSGLERAFRFSLGLDIGAYALALLAVLEYKRQLQNDPVGIGNNEHHIILSREEWRTAAGIFDLKTFARAKVKLEERGIIHINTNGNGKLLYITLWPNVEEATKKTSNRAFSRTRNETPEETSDRTPDETSDGTSCGTSLEPAPNIIRVTSWPKKRSFLPKRLSNTTVLPLKRYSLIPFSLRRYSLNRNTLLNNTKNNNTIIYLPNNNNEQRYNEKHTSNKNKKSLGKGIIGPKLRQLWREETGKALEPHEEEGFQTFIRLGFSEEILIEALRYAVMADRKHMGYVLGILRNWHNQNVRKYEDIALVQQKWQDQKFLNRKASKLRDVSNST